MQRIRSHPLYRRARSRVRIRVYGDRVQMAVKLLPKELRLPVAEAIVLEHDRQLREIARDRERWQRELLETQARRIAAELTDEWLAAGHLREGERIVFDEDPLLRKRL